MGFLLAAIFSAAFVWWLFRSPFFKIPEVGRKTLMWIFFIKLAAAFSYEQVYSHYYSGSEMPDTKAHYIASGIIYKSLVAHGEPGVFFRLLLGPNGGEPSPEIESYVRKIQTHWDSSSNYAMLRYNALLKVFSFGHLPAHIVIHVVLCFLGLLVLFKFISPQVSNSYWLLLLVFLFPSVLFWNSGLHKDGLVLAMLAVLITSALKLCQRISLKHIIILLLSGLLVWEFRVFYLYMSALFIVPLLIHFKIKTLKAWQFISISSILLILASIIIDIPELLQIRQSNASFFPGNSDSNFPKLEPTWSSVFANLHLVLYHAFIEPITLINGWGQRINSINSILILYVPIYMYYAAVKLKKNLKPISLYYIGISFCIILLAAYTTINVGSMIRYIAAVLPLLFIGLWYWPYQKDTL